MPREFRVVKTGRIGSLAATVAVAVCLLGAGCSTVFVESRTRDEFQAEFLELCDLAGKELDASTRKDPFFVDSYAVRALAVAYDMTGEESYLDACKAWSNRMITFQSKMIPRGAYYMNYNRKPGEDTGSWYVADSSSIAMGLLATAIRCEGAERQRYLDSVKSFAQLVMDNYVGKAGGIRNGFWPQYDGEWWCSSGIFGSLAFLLYDETGDKQYLKTALGTLRWLNALDLTADQPYPLKEMGPTMPMYVLEAYSAGLPHLAPGSPIYTDALAKIAWALDWMARNQGNPEAEKRWSLEKWGIKFGGLPFHMYVYSRCLPNGREISEAADRQMRHLAAVLSGKKPGLSQLAAFMMMSYAERLSPGTLYRTSRTAAGPTQR